LVLLCCTVFAAFHAFLVILHQLFPFFLSSNKNKAKGSNIGDAIVELLLHGGMPASLIEARLVEGKKLELGAASNQNKCVNSVFLLF
jgi:hypothetical protein